MALGLGDVETRVMDIVAALSRETSGARVPEVRPTISLERELGLGSLERAELLSRLERAFGRRLDESLLRADTPRELADALSTRAPVPPAAVEASPSAPLQAAGDLAPFTTISDALWRRAEASPDRPHVYLREDEGALRTVTYLDLLNLARRIGGGLRHRGVAPGDTVALMLPTGIDFLGSFQGILAAGAIPVPIYPPARLDRLREYLERQSAILADAGVKTLITVPRAVPVADVLRSRVPSLRHVVTADDLGGSGEALSSFEEQQGGDPAFIQYTSGSTGAPKGVLLTHDNLLANIRAIGQGLQVRSDDVGVSWLPLYHDMGLIGSWLFCMCRGILIDIQSPLSFLARPERWLWAIHHRRGTLSAAPNFAYELCVRKIRDEDLEGLDLSSWRCALNGAEPVSPGTLDRFVERFGPYGFRREALMPVYGLAENSVGLSMPPPGRGPRIDRIARGPFEAEGRAVPTAVDDESALSFASEGIVLPEHEVQIVDDNGDPVEERRLGRLVFRGPSMTPGYFHQPAATAAITLPGGWYDSGDLAYLAGGEIHIAGRRKDLIIKGGRNVVPHEVEEAAGGVDGVRRGCVVAFGLANDRQGTESVVVVAETRETSPQSAQRIEAEVREKIDLAVGVPADIVVLVPPGAVPKTSSGKIRRAATKDLYVAGTLGRKERLRLEDKVRLGASAARSAVSSRWRRVVDVAYAVYLIAAFALAALVAWPLALIVPGRRFASWLEKACLRYAVFVSGIRTSLEGSEHLKTAGPFILASNHTSYVDIPFLRALIPQHFVFLAKREVLAYPLVGLFLRKAGHITVDRQDATQSVAAASRVHEALQRGERVLLFPEATFTAADGLRPFRLGAFKIAAESGISIVPIALKGSREVLRDGTWMPRRRPVSLWIGAPVAPGGSSWTDVVALRDRVASAIAAHCGEPRLDHVVPGAPSRW